MKVLFGDSIRNTARADLYKGKVLIDHEAVIKDVCIKCNNALSNYDDAGKLFCQEIVKFFDVSNKFLTFNKLTLGWLLKSHLNYIRINPDCETGQSYTINPRLYTNIINYSNLNLGLFNFYIEGWQGTLYYWEADDERKISILNYRSVRFISQKIIVSNLRIKALNTFLFFPYDNNNYQFNKRCASVQKEMYKDLNFYLQHIDIGEVLQKSIFKITKVVSFEDLEKLKVFIEPQGSFFN